MALNPYLTLAAVLALGASHTLAYVKGGSAKEDAILAEQKRQDALIAQVQQTTAEAIAAIEVKNVTIRQRVERETRIVPDYSACHHSPDGLRDINAALTNSKPARGGELPEGTNATNR